MRKIVTSQIEKGEFLKGISSSYLHEDCFRRVDKKIPFITNIYFIEQARENQLTKNSSKNTFAQQKIAI